MTDSCLTCEHYKTTPCVRVYDISIEICGHYKKALDETKLRTK